MNKKGDGPIFDTASDASAISLFSSAIPKSPTYFVEKLLFSCSRKQENYDKVGMDDNKHPAVRSRNWCLKVARKLSPENREQREEFAQQLQFYICEDVASIPEKPVNYYKRRAFGRLVDQLRSEEKMLSIEGGEVHPDALQRALERRFSYNDVDE